MQEQMTHRSIYIASNIGPLSLTPLSSPNHSWPTYFARQCLLLRQRKFLSSPHFTPPISGLFSSTKCTFLLLSTAVNHSLTTGLSFSLSHNTRSQAESHTDRDTFSLSTVRRRPSAWFFRVLNKWPSFKPLSRYNEAERLFNVAKDEVDKVAMASVQ